MSELIVRDTSGMRTVRLGRLLTLGRSQNNDLVLNSVYTSRRHAWIWQQGQHFIIEDLGSTHGTYVNGERLTRPRFLVHHDLIIMGEARLTFVAGYDSSSDQTPPRGFQREPEAQVSGRIARESPDVGWPEDYIHTGRPTTPPSPVVARPFPTAEPRPRPGIGGKAWFLIILLAILAISLILIMGMLVAYILF